MSDTQAQGTHSTQRRRPTIAKEWQLAVLKKLQSESGSPTEEQRLAVVTETGLDEKWVRNWFTRQRSKLAARNRKRRPTSTESRQPTVQTFKVQLSPPPALPSGPQGLPSRRSQSTPIDPVLYVPTKSCQPSPASLESRSFRRSRSTENAQAIPRSNPSVSAPNNPPQNPTLVPHTTTIPTYSRDPLCNRYPDFSQFFHPQVHEQFCNTELSAAINNDNRLTDFLANPNVDPHASIHFQGLLDSLNPLHLGGPPTHQSSSTYLSPCPVAFSMRLMDLLSRPSLIRYPIFLPSELENRI